MKRKYWKWAFGISLALLILFLGFLLFLWAAATVLMTMWTAGLGQDLPEYMNLWEFYENFPGSPLFWPFVADVAVVILSAGMLIFKKKEQA